MSGLGGYGSLSPPHRQTHWSTISRWVVVVWNCQILIVSAVKICKRCLQTTSASRGLPSPDPIPGFCPCTPLGDFRPHTPYWGITAAPHWGTSIHRPPGLIVPQMKTPGTASDDSMQHVVYLLIIVLSLMKQLTKSLKRMWPRLSA